MAYSPTDHEREELLKALCILQVGWITDMERLAHKEAGRIVREFVNRMKDTESSKRHDD